MAAPAVPTEIAHAKGTAAAAAAVPTDARRAAAEDVAATTAVVEGDGDGKGYGVVTPASRVTAQAVPRSRLSLVCRCATPLARCHGAAPTHRAKRFRPTRRRAFFLHCLRRWQRADFAKAFGCGRKQARKTRCCGHRFRPLRGASGLAVVGCRYSFQPTSSHMFSASRYSNDASNQPRSVDACFASSCSASASLCELAHWAPESSSSFRTPRDLRLSCRLRRTRSLAQPVQASPARCQRLTASSNRADNSSAPLRCDCAGSFEVGRHGLIGEGAAKIDGDGWGGGRNDGNSSNSSGFGDRRCRCRRG